MGMFSNAVFRYEFLPNGVCHIYDEGLDEISVTNDAESVLMKIHRDLQEHASVAGLSGKKVQYTDSEGQIDKLLHENGVFKGFSPGPWD